MSVPLVVYTCEVGVGMTVCVGLLVDAEVYDEMHHKTINIHYHTHRHKSLGHFGGFPL